MSRTLAGLVAGQVLRDGKKSYPTILACMLVVSLEVCFLSLLLSIRMDLV
jgi:hypothetical protein